MSKKRKNLKFVGQPFTVWEHRALLSLIEMTAGRFRIHKKDFATEAMFWDVIHAITGFRKSNLETLQEAVGRISISVRSKGLAWRDIRIAAVDPEAIRAMFKSDRRHSESVKTYGPVYEKRISSFISKEIKDEFYKSWEWRTLRMEAIHKHGNACQCCGASPAHKDAAGKPVRICVDHIKPISKYWELRLDPSNLQILCDECNQGKGNWSETDFRPAPVADEWVLDDVGVSDAILSQLTDRTTGRLQ